MFASSRKDFFGLLLILLLMGAGHSFGQTTGVRTLRNMLDGNSRQLAKDSIITLQDDPYFSPALISKLDTPYKVKNIITFRLNEYASYYLPASFTATVNARIIYTRPDFALDSVDRSFTINYDVTGSYTNRSSFVFENAHKVSVKILSISVPAAANVLKSLILENEMQVFPVYKLSCTDDAVKMISFTSAPNTDSTDELAVSWPVVTGADSYDLEWAYVDSAAYTSNKYGNPLKPVLLFRNNSSRVTVKGNTYRIPLLYDNGGILFFRARAVQERSGTSRMETAWSSDYTGGLGRFSFTGHQRRLNWTSAIDYAEDGKRKAVVKYFDGSLRDRQLVTKDNSTNTTITTETFYDYQGRPTIQVMPAPSSLNSVIKYAPRFNRALNGAEYDKSLYDKLNSPAEYETARAAPMSNTSGANQYYSTNNPDKNTGVNQFIPDAGGYAFTETVYTQDNTGRVSRQSGVGPVYAIGGNHETKYFYGSPGENDLDVLFGTEAGDKRHYFKNMVQDANGQYTVSYLDMYGRTVATALAGSPDSASVDDLSSNVSFSVTDTLSRASSNTIKDLVMESRQSQLVPVESNYQFRYSLAPPVLQQKDCNNNTICYTARYDLQITITDDAYNQHLGGKPFDTIISNYTGASVPDCTTPQPVQISFILRLPRGNYEISKRLIVNRDAMAYYRDSIFMKKNLCTTLEQFVQQQRDFLANTDCIPNCAACRDSIGTWEYFRNRYMTAGGIAPGDTLYHRGEALAAYGEALTACDAVCDKATEATDMGNALLLDVSAPSGQYADPEDTLNIYSVFYQEDEENLPPYRRDTVTYLDEAGRPDLVYDEFSNTYVVPQKLRPEQFAAKFKASWAPALLKFHPEYCKYLEFQKHQASYAWDREFEKIETYAEAKEKGYLNPIGQPQTEVPFLPVTVNIDPLSKESTAMYNVLKDRLTNYNKGTGASILSMWSTATATVKCAGNDAVCVNSYKAIATAFDESVLCKGDLDMAWRNFRQLYLAAKRTVIDDKIKNAVCPAGVKNPTSALLLAAGKQLNFNNATDALHQHGLGYLNDGNQTGASDAANQAVQQHYEDNCKAYAKVWVQQLAPCKYTQAMLDILIPRLVQVCKEGSDIAHPNGSSSVAPSSTYAYKSFQQVLEEFNQQQGISSNVDCNEYVLTAPAPYDKQPGFGNKPVYTKPEPCECEKLNKYYAEYIDGGDLYPSFASYLEWVKHIKIDNADVRQLLNACNQSSSCTYFEKVISLPPGLQCYTGEACASCKVVNEAYNAFTAKYPAVVPTIAETDTVQQKKNKLFTNFMNNQLGITKQAWEYLQFKADCPKAPVPHGDICDSLMWAKNEFLRLYSAGMNGNDSMKLSRTLIGRIGTHIISTDNRPAWSGTESFAAAVWKDSSNRIFRLRDNLIFDFGKGTVSPEVPYHARITNATIVMDGRPRISPPAPNDLFQEITTHYSTSGTAFGYLERALGPVIPGVTTFATLPAVTTANRVRLSTLPVGASVARQALTCTALAADMYADYQNGINNGLIFRMDEATEAGTENNSYVFNYSPTSSINTTVPWLTINYVATPCDEWATRFNYWFNRSFTPAQIDSMFLVNCGVPSGFCGAGPQIPDLPELPEYPDDPQGPKLCGKAEPIFPPVDLNTVNNCSDSTFFAISKGTELYHAYRDSLLGSFNQYYINTALQAANKEVFTVSYATSEYHYTLFYYDQAGNLVKTIPPAGVVINRSTAWVNSVRAARAKGQYLVPPHTKATQYRYNTLNQIIEQRTPDAGIGRFWYDRKGKMAASQNSKQVPLRKYNYYVYDALGRTIETGELTSVNPLAYYTYFDATTFAKWFSSGRTSCVEVTKTTYDVAYSPLSQLILSARNLRNRVSWTAFYTNVNTLAAGNYSAASFYTYDVSGNIDTLLNDYKIGGMADAGNRFKKIVYKYDLISGKVKQVAYQPSQADAFHHRYTYDAENRLVNVETSRDGIYWENDAYYTYYKHGPLARTVLGQQQVQGLDYAYTLQGWTKGVNTTAIGGNTDMGKDGIAGSAVARDAIGFGLYYYGMRDYNPIGSVAPFAPIEGTGFKPLFNGNITAISRHIPAMGESLLSTYNYDVLNRLKGVQAVRGLNTTTNRWTPAAIADFKEGITYDADGNILTYARNGNNTFAGKPLTMDQLTYNYKAGKNQLDFITDTVGNDNYDIDIDSQTAGNYAYDSTGSLIKDVASGISNITWTSSGKIASITKTDGTVISYTYDVTGNRISKTVGGVQTWYVRDATGNVMSLYTKGNSAVNGGNLTQTETHLYGSKRMGIGLWNTDMQQIASPEVVPLRGLGNGTSTGFVRGNKRFELPDHLGNVLATISDKKRAVSTDSTSISYYMPDVLSTQEYYSFGMGMPGRNTNSSGYRYGFNGMENDNEVKGNGNQIDFGERIHDPRSGRFMSVDPLANKYPFQSSYAFAANSPITLIDVRGMGPGDPTEHTVKKGETLSKISKQYGVSVADIGKMNGIEDVDKISIGQVIQVNPEANFSKNPRGGYKNPDNAIGTEITSDHISMVGINFTVGLGEENSIIVGGDALTSVQEWPEVQNRVSRLMNDVMADGRVVPGEAYQTPFHAGSLWSNVKKGVAEAILDGVRGRSPWENNSQNTPIHVLGSFSISLRVNADGTTATVCVYDSKSFSSLSDNIFGKEINRKRSDSRLPPLTNTYQRYLWNTPIE